MTADARTVSLSSTQSVFFEGESPLLYVVAFWLALIQVSIAAAQIVLAAVVLTWLFLAWKGAVSFVRLPIDRPLLLYAATSLVAAAMSFDPAASLFASKKLFLLLVPYVLVSVIRKKETLEQLVLVLVGMADIGALVGLWQYRFGDLGDLDHRIRGFLGHYMTYSGLLMGVSVLALGLLIFRGKHRPFLIGSLALVQFALLLSLTRSAWLGMAAATLVLLFLKDPRLPALLPAAALGAVLLLPNAVDDRLASFLRPDTSGWDRLYMVRSGALIVRNHPWLGVGPEMVSDVYPIYKVPEAPMRENPHLHNNLAQIAAERGLLCLVAWLWLIGSSLAASLHAFRDADEDDSLGRALAAGALGLMLAAFVAGLFEYNFGDSEFQMLFLFALTIPFLLRRFADESKDSAAPTTATATATATSAS